MGAEKEKSTTLCIGWCGGGAGSNTSVADIKDGKIVRIRPLHFDWKYDQEYINPWKWEARGKTFEVSKKTLIPPFSLAYKKRVYSPNRILYPLKRVDWDPNGERNTQNRGKSKYVRISWDEALDIIEGEIRRIHKEYGPTGILAQCDGHGETKTLHVAHGANKMLLDLMGGCTVQTRNTDSWEGWMWGAKHVWGMDMNTGQMTPNRNVMVDIAEHSQTVLFWGCDPETTPWGFDGQMASRLCYHWSEVGVKQVYICPDVNYGAAVHADKWIPILPGTDAALQLAIAYVWITEGTYDKEYLKNHAVGFEKVADYVLGKEDGIPKTPEWASQKCRVPEWTIKALARDWASKATTVAHGNGGPGIRSPYSTENARLDVILIAMQGLGKPGTHQIKMIEWGWPIGKDESNPMPNGIFYPHVAASQTEMIMMPKGAEESLIEGEFVPQPIPKELMSEDIVKPGNRQFIPKNLIHDALSKKTVSWYGTTVALAPTEDQFVKYTYPAPGCSEVHMIWTDTPCWVTCWNDTNEYLKALRGENIEFILAQHPWLENDCQMADLILPVNTKFEEHDVDIDCMSGQYYILVHQEQSIEALGESMSDYEVVAAIAERFGLKEKFTKGESIEDKVKFVFEHSGVQNHITYEEFKEKGYYVVPTDPDWKKHPVGLVKFYEEPDNNPLSTPSGKLEFYSERLAKYFPDDQERAPIPKWVEKGEQHDERISSERARKYPLLVLSNHGRWRVHANNDDISWTRECPTGKVKGFDGYLYEPMWINTDDAMARGIKDGDICRIYNERGSVLVGAYVTERIMPGAVSIDHGARYDPIIVGELDRGGAINTLTPHALTSKNTSGMVVSSFLTEVEKVTKAQMDEWKEKYPETFEKAYDPAAGLILQSLLV